MSEVIDVDIAEVRAMGQMARFYRDENGRDMIEIGFTGMKDTVVSKVLPKHMSQFREEWNAFCDGVPPKKRDGTDLTDVKGINDLLADTLEKANVHNAEELAALNDAQCQALGHGILTMRKAARELLGLRLLERQQSTIDAMTKATQSLASAPAAPSEDVVAMKAEIAALKDGQMAILEALKAMAPKKPGRPKKEAPKAE